MKRIATVLALAALSPAAFAQSQGADSSRAAGPSQLRSQPGVLHVGADAGLSLPLGDYDDLLDVGFAVHGRLEAEILPRFTLGGSIGYARYSLDFDDVEGVEGTLSVVPMVGTARWALQSSREGFYVGSDVGLYRVGVTVKATDGMWAGRSDSDSETELGMAPFAGYRTMLGDDFTLDAGAKLTIVDTDGDESFKSMNLLVGVSKIL